MYDPNGYQRQRCDYWHSGGCSLHQIDDQTGHVWDGAGCIEFALGATILCFVDHDVDVVIKEALFPFLIAS